MAWIRRRQQRKATIRVARLLVALDGLASARSQTRRAMRASLGTNR
jgi:hypothetical protein